MDYILTSFSPSPCHPPRDAIQQSTTAGALCLDGSILLNQDPILCDVCIRTFKMVIRVLPDCCYLPTRRLVHIVVFLEIEIKNIKSVTVKRIVNAVVFYYCVYYFFNYLYIYKWEEMRTW